MAGLREKKKKESEEKIKSAAKEILLTKGYTNTTMEEIAEKAEIGVGTLYNYFKSKAEIFVSIMSEQLLFDEKDNELLGNDLENDAVEIIIVYLQKFIKNMKLFGKEMLRELTAAVFSSIKPDNLMLKGMMKVDFMFIEKLERLLDSIKQKRVFPQSFKTNEAAYALYSIVFTQIMLYVYIEEITFEDLEESIEKQIRFLFEGKCRKQNH